jgi:hypothetical protein
LLPNRNLTHLLRIGNAFKQEAVERALTRKVQRIDALKSLCDSVSGRKYATSQRNKVYAFFGKGQRKLIIMKLLRPAQVHEEQIMLYREAFLNSGEYLYGGSSLQNYERYEEWIEKIISQEKGQLPPNRVPATQS